MGSRESELRRRNRPRRVLRKSALVALLLAVVIPGASLDVPEPATSTFKLFQHQDTVAWSCASLGVSAFVYEAGMAVDADGAPRAYHPKDLGLDSLVHAGY